MIPHVVSSPTAMVQLIATNLLTAGYRYFVTGVIPEHKDPTKTDSKLIEQYGLDLSRWQRARRKENGRASIRYLRHGQFFIMLATEGHHPWFRLEGEQLRDARRDAIRFGGYLISLKRGPDRGSVKQPRSQWGWHVRVWLDRETYNDLKAHFLGIAVHRSAEELRREFWLIPYEPYAALRRQLLAILKATNRKRKSAGLEPLPYDVLRYRRRIVKVFGEADSTDSAKAA
jgi:hypothetical protein